MAIPVVMPRQGQSVEVCVISQWFKKKGDSVKTGEPLFSYETDKASFEEEAKVDGVLLEIFYAEGDEVPVLHNVAVIGQIGESVEEFRSGAGSSSATVEAAPEPTVIEAAAVSSETVVLPVPTALSDAKIRVSPRARIIAQKNGVNLYNIKGTGPNGRIIARDVSAPAATLLKGEEVTPAPKKAAPVAITASVGEYGDAEYEIKNISNIRKLIGKSMYESLQNSAQLTHHLGADVRKLLALREEFKNMQKADPTFPNITINDMICLAVIRALLKFPEVNSHFLGNSIKTFKKVHLALAVDTPRGLMVPVLKNADDLSLKGLSNNLRTLANSCRKGNIDPDLLQSDAGSFTVSNLGAYCVEMFTPIINMPQVAILGVNTIVHRPADIGEGIMAFVPYIGLSLTYDHRAIDGGPATLFLKEIKTQIENIEYA